MIGRGRDYFLAGAAMIAVSLGVYAARRDAYVACRPGLVKRGARCCVTVSDHGSCASSLRPQSFSRADRILVVSRSVELRGESFERSQPSTTSVQTASFELLRTELRCGDAMLVLGSSASATTSRLCEGDAERAAGGLSFPQAERVCRALGGRLPSEAEWQRAAGARGTRYPWGETGATCRVAVWGIDGGPCFGGSIEPNGANSGGPDTVDSRPAGASVEGVIDLAGNVGEWVTSDGAPVLKGGDYASLDAAELRVFARRSAPRDETLARNGARCAFDLARPPAGSLP